MRGDEAFKVQAGEMERDRVRVDISKRDMATNQARLSRAKALLRDLRDQDSSHRHQDTQQVKTRQVKTQQVRTQQVKAQQVKMAPIVHAAKVSQAVETKHLIAIAHKVDPVQAQSDGSKRGAKSPVRALGLMVAQGAKQEEAVVHVGKVPSSVKVDKTLATIKVDTNQVDPSLPSMKLDKATLLSAPPPAPAQIKHVTKKTVEAAAALVGAVTAVKYIATAATKHITHLPAHRGQHTLAHKANGGLHTANWGAQKANGDKDKTALEKTQGGGKSAFSRAVDSIGLPHVAVAEEKEMNEGGSAGREMELASGAYAVLTSHGIDHSKVFKPSISEEVASLVYESSKSNSLHQHPVAAPDVHNADDRSLPLIERSLILNW